VNLRDLAALDHIAILTDGDGGFGWPIIVTNPDGLIASTTGFTSDVGEVVDPQSGLEVMGRRVTVQVLPAPLVAAGLGVPAVVAETNRKPWTMRFADASGRGRTYKVVTVAPDGVLGSLRCGLEAYTPPPG
jgi:hypothetical protein